MRNDDLTQELKIFKSQFKSKLKESFPVNPIPTYRQIAAGIWHEDTTYMLFEEKAWPNVADSLQKLSLDLYGVVLAGIVYYLPAVLLAVVEDIDDHGGNLANEAFQILKPKNYWGLSRSDMSESQVECICEFLEAMTKFGFVAPGDSFETDLAQGIAYWGCSTETGCC